MLVEEAVLSQEKVSAGAPAGAEARHRDPNGVRRADGIAVRQGVAGEVRAAQAVAEQALANAARSGSAQVALVNGTPGILVGRGGRLTLVLSLTIHNEKITAIDVLPTRPI